MLFKESKDKLVTLTFHSYITTTRQNELFVSSLREARESNFDPLHFPYQYRSRGFMTSI